MNDEQLQAIKALAARDESTVAMCSEYRQAIVTLLGGVERLRIELARAQRIEQMHRHDAEERRKERDLYRDALIAAQRDQHKDAARKVRKQIFGYGDPEVDILENESNEEKPSE